MREEIHEERRGGALVQLPIQSIKSPSFSEEMQIPSWRCTRPKLRLLDSSTEAFSLTTAWQIYAWYFGLLDLEDLPLHRVTPIL